MLVFVYFLNFILFGGGVMEFDFLLFPIRYNVKDSYLVLKFHYDCLKIGGFPNMPVIDIHLNLWFETLAAEPLKSTNTETVPQVDNT